MHIITNAMRHGLSTAVHTSSPVIKEYDTLHCAFHKPAMTQPLASQSVSPSVQSSPAHSKPSVRQSSPVQSSTFQAILPYWSSPIPRFSLYELTLSFKCISLSPQFDLAVVILLHEDFKNSHYFTLYILILISFMFKSSLQQPVFNFKLCSPFQVTDKVFYQHCM